MRGRHARREGTEKSDFEASWAGATSPLACLFRVPRSFLLPIFKHLALVQTLDSAIHRINHYPADKYQGNQLRYPLDRSLFGR